MLCLDLPLIEQIAFSGAGFRVFCLFAATILFIIISIAYDRTTTSEGGYSVAVLFYSWLGASIE